MLPGLGLGQQMEAITLWDNNYIRWTKVPLTTRTLKIQKYCLMTLSEWQSPGAWGTVLNGQRIRIFENQWSIWISTTKINQGEWQSLCHWSTIIWMSPCLRTSKLKKKKWIKSAEMSQSLPNTTSQVFIYLGPYILPSLIKRFNKTFWKWWSEMLTQARARDHGRTWIPQIPNFSFSLATADILINAHPEELLRKSAW